MEEQLILVDQSDQVVGYAGKIDTHRRGLLHRAFSILIYNTAGEMLLQKRAPGKYHSGGLWTNACCSHPLKGAGFSTCLHRRLREEMGIDCELDFAFSFIYKAEFENGLIEHELDHVYTGLYDGEVKPDPSEVGDYKWTVMDELTRDVKLHPEQYTYWFRLIIQRISDVNSRQQENC